MRTIKFQGHSDDVFEIHGTVPSRGEPHQSDCYERFASVKIVYGEFGVWVHGRYAPADTAATWMIGIAPLDEDIPLPGWAMRWGTAENGYSPILEIDIPDDAFVRNGRRDDD